MAPVVVHCGFFRREILPALDHDDGDDQHAAHFSNNKSLTTLDACVNATKARVEYLWQAFESSTEAFVHQKTLFIVWQLNIANKDFANNPEWLQSLAEALCLANFPKLAVRSYLAIFRSLHVSATEDTWRWVDNFFGILINFTEISQQFRQALAEAGAIEQFFDLVDRMKISPDQSVHLRKKKEILIGHAFGVLFNLSKALPTLKENFDRSNVANILGPYFECKDCCYVKVLACLLAIRLNLASHLTSDTGILRVLLDYFTLASVGENRRFRGISCLEIGDGFRLFAASDISKRALIDAGILNIVNDLLYSTIEAELELGVDLLSTLCSSPENCGQVAASEETNRALQSLANDDNDSDLKGKAINLLDFISERSRQPSTPLTSPRLAPALLPGKRPSVYLSFFKHDLPIVKKIERLLVSNDFQVVNPVSPNTHQPAEQAMPRANVVAICHSESYNLSSHCKEEAELAKSLHKKIVSVRIDQDYEPVGWLEQLLEYSTLVNVDVDEDLLKMNATCKNFLQQLSKLLVD